MPVSYELSPEDHHPTTREPEPAPPPEPAPRVVEGLAQRSPEDRSRVLRALSRTSGNRAVTALLQRDPVLPAPPQTQFKAATTMHAYIDLVEALEHDYPAASPREILTLLRSVYYGRPWSVSPAAEWADVLPGARPASDPRKVTGSGPGTLYDALRHSQVVDGTDVGHVLTGIEAMVEQKPSVTLHGPAGVPITVQMPNVEFATWGGDVGSVAAMRMADQMTDADMKDKQAYFTAYASDSDLEGDVDAYALKEQMGGDVKFALQRSFSITTPADVSHWLSRLFLTEGPGSEPAREHRYSHFIAAIGGRRSGGKITNRMDLLKKIAPRIQSFAEVFLLNELRKRQGTAGVGIELILTATGDTDWLDILEEYCWDALDEFFDWLEPRAAAE